MKRTYISVVLVFLLITLVSCGNKKKSNQDTFKLEKEALELLKNSSPDSLKKAIVILDKAIKITPDKYTLHVNKAYIYNKLGNYVEAETSLDVAIRQKDEFAEAWLMKGLLQKKLAKDTAALNSFVRAEEFYTLRINRNDKYKGSQIINRWIAKYLISGNKDVIIEAIKNSSDTDDVKKVAIEFIEELNEDNILNHFTL